MSNEEVVRAVISALDELSIPYILVGSFSSNFYGIPRSTNDADFVLSLGDVPIKTLMERLGSGFRLDPQMSFETVTGTYRYVVEALEAAFTIEVFLLTDEPHDQERFARRQRVATHLGAAFLPTAEDVIVTKLNWAKRAGRPKDTADVRNVIAVQGNRLDWDYIHGWCERHGTRELLDDLRKSLPPQ